MTRLLSPIIVAASVLAVDFVHSRETSALRSAVLEAGLDSRFPVGEFNVSDHDPFVLAMQWDRVIPLITARFPQYFENDSDPGDLNEKTDLSLGFQWINEGRHPARLKISLDGNLPEEVKQAIRESFGFGEDAFQPRLSYGGDAGMVLSTEFFARDLFRGGKLDLDLVQTAVYHTIINDKQLADVAKTMGGRITLTKPKSPKNKVEILTEWQVLTEHADRVYYWRLSASVEPNKEWQDAWEVRHDVQLGERYRQSQRVFLVSESTTARFAMNPGHPQEAGMTEEEQQRKQRERFRMSPVSKMVSVFENTIGSRLTPALFDNGPVAAAAATSAPTRRRKLGINCYKCNDGIHVRRVYDDSPAANCRDRNGNTIFLEPDDHIVLVNGVTPRSYDHFLMLIQESDRTMRFTILDHRTNRRLSLRTDLW
jgi:hypothetical protein